MPYNMKRAKADPVPAEHFPIPYHIEQHNFAIKQFLLKKGPTALKCFNRVSLFYATCILLYLLLPMSSLK